MVEPVDRFRPAVATEAPRDDERIRAATARRDAWPRDYSTRALSHSFCRRHFGLCRLRAQALPANFISPNVPHDVPAGPDATVAQLAVFAWQEFIALNWQANDPAQSGTRGRPNTNVDFLDIAPTNGIFPLVVWQTYRHKNELFPATGPRSHLRLLMPTYRYQCPLAPHARGRRPDPELQSLQQSRRDEPDRPEQHVCPRQRRPAHPAARDTRGLRGKS